ncbi:hypothetical protein [Aliivibrio fischeri]|uniref:Uncharacterized protein n=1 Tax=Aliivibrio fischeri TaxID=668 RepID=A0A510URS9_ALIFS|nr:hypothetical protein [Aliivibrio fischeri]GEK15940.1 hypothetical protein AFI02nite_39760 [Aliivibrio fischeri]
MTKERINPWLEKSIENILPLSISNDFKVAFSEWLFSGEVIDYGHVCVECELCEHDELRYHYKINNKLTDKLLWVGSSCILRFEEIAVFNENNEAVTSPDERRKVLERALKDKQIDISLEPLRKLWSVNFERRNYIHYQAEEIKSRNSISPDALNVLFMDFKKFEIDFKPEHYSVNLRDSLNQYQLLNMNEESQKLIWKTMSSQQHTKYRNKMKFKT